MKIQVSKNEKSLFYIVVSIIGAFGLMYFLRTIQGVANAFKWSDFATILALLLGPIFAVLITRRNDESRAKKERQLMTFRSLMKTRGNLVPSPSQEFVEALNLVPVDFHGNINVQSVWKDLFKALHPNPPPTIGPGLSDWFYQCQILTAKLLDEMGHCLDIDIPQLDIMRECYSPTGIQNERTRKERILNGVDQLLSKTLLSKQDLINQGRTSPPEAQVIFDKIESVIDEYLNRVADAKPKQEN